MAARSIISTLFAVPLLAACLGPELPADSSGEARAAQRLSGLVAGAPVACLPHYNSQQMEVIDRDTILFEAGGTLYRQDAIGTCYPGGREAGYTLVTNDVATGGRLCAGEVAKIVNTSGGFLASTCTFDRFVPYRRP